MAGPKTRLLNSFGISLSELKNSSIQKQIAGMYSWAVKAYERTNDPKQYPVIKDFLRDINHQGRRLEWRGGSLGIKHLPGLEEVKTLKLKVSQARADAQTALDAVGDLENSSKEIKQLEERLKENETKLSSAGTTKAKWISANIVSIKRRLAKINKEIGAQKKTAGKTISILTEVLKEADALAQEEPWQNLKYLLRPENKVFAEQLLRLEGYYYDNPKGFMNLRTVCVKNGLFKSINMSGMRFINAGYDNAIFTGINAENVGFSESGFKHANFSGSTLKNVYFALTNMDYSNFRGASLDNIKVHHSTFTKAVFNNANISGLNCLDGSINFNEVDFTGVKIYGSDFSKARLIKANFRKATIIATSFKGANCTDADFGAVHFLVEKDSFEDADLTGANFEGATGLTKATLKSANNWEKANNVTFSD